MYLLLITHRSDWVGYAEYLEMWEVGYPLIHLTHIVYIF